MKIKIGFGTKSESESKGQPKSHGVRNVPYVVWFQTYWQNALESDCLTPTMQDTAGTRGTDQVRPGKDRHGPLN